MKNWCFWTVVLEKTLENPLDFKEIKPVSPKGNQSWVFNGRTDAKAEAPILWPSEEKYCLNRKDPEAGKDWGQEENGMTEDETVGWHHWLDEHEFEQAPRVGDGHYGKPGILQSMGSQSRTGLSNWTECIQSTQLALLLSVSLSVQVEAIMPTPQNFTMG